VRALVGKLGFGSNQHDLADESGVPQAGRDGVPGGTAADDQRFRVSSRTRNNDQARYPPSTAVANP
jgi:hypothetical protein